MRASLLLTTTILTLIFLTTCRREKYCCGPSSQPGLTGNWQLLRIDGGLAPGRIVPADFPVVLTLNNDSTYDIRARSLVVEAGNFHIADTPVYGTTQPAIVFSISGPKPYRMSEDSLFLGDDAADGLLLTYLKIN